MMKLLLFLLFASQCPLAHGVAVFKARALLSIVEDADYDDYAVCSAMGLQPLVQSGENAETFVQVFPNPVQDVLQVKHNLELSSTFVVFDVLGRRVARASLTPDTPLTNVDVSSLLNGLYFYKAINSLGTSVASGSFVIAK